MKKVSIITLTLAMLINGSVVYSAPKRKRAVTNTGTSALQKINTNEEVEQKSVEEITIQTEEVKDYTLIKQLLNELQTDMEKAKSSCSGIKDDLKTIQVLAGVSTGASSLGTLASGGALATGIMKAKTDKQIAKTKAELEKMSLAELREELDNIEQKLSSLNNQISEEEKKSKTLGNVRTGLMAGSIATSAASTITSGISIKKLDDLIDKMKDCNRTTQQIKSDISVIQSEIDDIEYLKDDYRFYKAGNIVNSCSGFDTNNIKEIKGVMTASTVVGGVGTVVSTAGTITSALANSKKIRNDDSEDGVKKEKGLNLASNIMAGVATGTSAGGIVLGAVTLSKLTKNVDVAESCEDALK